MAVLDGLAATVATVAVVAIVAVVVAVVAVVAVAHLVNAVAAAIFYHRRATIKNPNQNFENARHVTDVLSCHQ